MNAGGSVIGALNARAGTMATADPVDRAIDAVAREDAPPAARSVAPSAEDAPILPGDDDVASADASASALAESTPSWFDVNAFRGEDFDAGAYVESLGAYVSMDELKAELERYQSRLRERLVDVVNRDYDKFLRISEDVVDVESAVSEWEAPLANFKAEVEATRAELVEALNEMDDVMRRRQECADQRATLELMLDVNNLVTKVERLLDELDPDPAGTAGTAETASRNGWAAPTDRGPAAASAADPNATTEESDAEDDWDAADVEVTADDEEGLDALRPRLVGGDDAAALALAGEDDKRGARAGGGDAAEARARTIERVSGEVNRLRFYRGKGERLKFVRALGPRIEACETRLAAALRDATAAAAASRSRAALSHCLRAHVAVGRVDEAEEIVRRAVARPAVTRVVESDADADYPHLLDRCATAALEACDVELELTRDAESDLAARFNLLANAVLAEVDARVAEAKPGAFSPGNPDAFRRNHAAFTALLDRLEERVPTLASLRAFRESEAMTTATRRWNASAYFALRFREIADAVESGLDDERLIRAVERGTSRDRFLLAATEAAWEGLGRCWREDVFVPRAAEKFLKLSAQIVSWYDGWLSEGVAAVGTETAGGAEATGDAEAAGGAEAGGADGGAEASGDGSTAAAAPRPPRSWGASAGDDDLLAARADVDLFLRRVVNELIPLATSTVRTALGDAAGEAVAECLLAGVDEATRGGAAELDAAVARIVADRCAAALKQMKGITATFRMTNKPLPTRHSHFVPGVLAPIRAFVESPAARALTRETRERLAAAAAERVSATYADMAGELVASVRKTEASLNRLKDRKATKAGATGSNPGGDDAGKPTDTEKICKQLHLDVAEYAAGLASLGIDPGDSAAFKALWAVAAPEGEPAPSL